MDKLAHEFNMLASLHDIKAIYENLPPLYHLWIIYMGCVVNRGSDKPDRRILPGPLVVVTV